MACLRLIEQKRLSQMHLTFLHGSCLWGCLSGPWRLLAQSIHSAENAINCRLPNSKSIQHPRDSDVPSPKFNTAPSPFTSRDLFGLCHRRLFLPQQGHTMIKLLLNHSPIRHCSSPFVLFKPSISCVNCTLQANQKSSVECE